jgi:hypothetical protein
MMARNHDLIFDYDILEMDDKTTKTIKYIQ